MKPYTYYVPTMFFFGDHILEQKAPILFEKYGKKAAIITTKFLEGCENTALTDTCEVLEKSGIAYVVNDETEENPSVRNVLEITKKLMDEDVDFLIGVGGGSPIDCAKSISVLMAHPEGLKGIEEATEVFYDGSLPFETLWSEGALPVFAVPTTAGTGSEVTCFAVLTDEKAHTKRAISHPVYCVAGFLDARYIVNAPEIIIVTGAMDALAHGCETYVNKTSNQMNRAMAEIGFRLFSEVKDHLRDRCLEKEDYEKLVMFSNIMGIAFMRNGTTLPHGMSYPLSHFKGVNHGLSCSVTLGEYYRNFRDKTLVNRAVELCGFKDVDEFAEYCRQIVSYSLDITVTEEEIEAWADDFITIEDRMKKHPEKVTRDDIVHIYHEALKNYIVKEPE